MKLVLEKSPYIRKPVSVTRMMTDVLIALIPVVIYSIIKFGWYAVAVLVVSLISMIGTETLYHLAIDRKDFKNKFSINNILCPAISAIIYAMIVPSNLHLYSVAVIGIMAIFLGKLVFGGLGSNIFNPAGVGRALILAMAGGIGGKLWSSGVDVNGGATALGMVALEKGQGLIFNGLDNFSLWDLFIGNTPGALGEGCILAILIGGIYLFVRKSADYRPCIAMILTFALLMLTAGIFGKVNNPFEFLLYQLFSGGLIFGAVYMITDPVTSPVTQRGRFIYGGMVGIIVAFFRLFAALPEGCVFAILIANACVPAIDYYKWSGTTYTKKFFIVCASVMVVSLLLMGLLVGVAL